MIQSHHYRVAIQTFILVTVCLFLATKLLYQTSPSSPSSLQQVVSVFTHAAPSTPADDASAADPDTGKPPEHVYAANTGAEQEIKPMTKEEKLAVAANYVPAIMDLDDKSVNRLTCAPINENRYQSLKADATTPHTNSMAPAKAKYLFALDLFECAHILPTLMGSIVQTMRFLGPQNCALSVVEGRSRDSTREILDGMKTDLEQLGAKYFVGDNDVDPKDGKRDRIAALADLRNQAIEPLITQPDLFDMDATVVFINDVALCMDDILELLFQQNKQGADMTCAMDWLYGGGIFYDVWVARGMTGDTFFEVPQDGSWGFAENLFWADNKSKTRLDAFKPFQVYACWNGMSVFKAQPIMEKTIRFRGSEEGECYMGEPTLFCKDLWKAGHNKIQVVPSVNLGYSVEDSQKAKDRYGRVRDLVDRPGVSVPNEMIEWQATPPAMVKCARTFTSPYWVPPL